MKSEANCSKKFTKKQIIIQASTTIPAILFAQVLSSYGYGLIGWFIAGVVMAIGVNYAYRAKENRWRLFNIAHMVLTGIVASGAYHYVTKWIE